jgi:hypothetical protein
VGLETLEVRPLSIGVAGGLQVRRSISAAKC